MFRSVADPVSPSAQARLLQSFLSKLFNTISMPTIAELCQKALEELANCGIPDPIKNHRSMEAARFLSHSGVYNYEDHGNYTGSLVMLLLFHCDVPVSGRFGTFRLLEKLNGHGDRAEDMIRPGQPIQHSGKGPNNYRTNLLEALLGHLGDRVPTLQQLWEQVHGWVWQQYLEHEKWWPSDQLCCIQKILDDDTDVTTDVTKHLIRQICRKQDLLFSDYYLMLKKLVEHLRENDRELYYSYQNIQLITGCGNSASRKLWHCIAIIKEALVSWRQNQISIKRAILIFGLPNEESDPWLNPGFQCSEPPQDPVRVGSKNKIGQQGKKGNKILQQGENASRSPRSSWPS